MNQHYLPPLGQLWREAGAFASLGRRAAAPLPCATDRYGHGRPVIVVPGFLATDGSTTALRSNLAAAGYDVRGWGQGMNLGATEARLDRLERDVADLADEAGEPVALIGWSLGGLYAREIAKRIPDAVDRVITLGSPFSGSLRGNRVWWLYELVNR
ncbi:MAG: alpha/beta hydrolase, partial [Candidatus Accumulibacter sp.]|nr:alpha/beta hydrolase [Accumulibacter sp.]